MKYSIAQIQQLLRQAGWPEELIVEAAAVFYYESARGNPRAGKVDSIERSYGLAQINLGLPGTRLAAERAVWGPPERLYDPIYNLQIALQIYQQQGWRAWYNTYYGGRYRQFLPESQRAYASSASSAPPITTGDDFENYPDVFDADAWLPTPPNTGSVSVVGVVAAVAIAVVVVVLLDL